MIYKHLHSNCSQESVSFAWETWYGMKGKDYEMHWFILQKKGGAVEVLGGFRPKKEFYLKSRMSLPRRENMAGMTVMKNVVSPPGVCSCAPGSFAVLICKIQSQPCNHLLITFIN